jgi:hypothetical protein
VQDRGSHDLDVEVPLADGPPRGLADAGEGLGDEIVEGLAVLESTSELVRLAPQLGVGEVLDLGLEGVDQTDDVLEPLDLATLTHAGQLVQDHRTPRVVRGMPVGELDYTVGP